MNEAYAQGEPTWTEADRLAALNRYGILDTPAEQEFEDLVRLAAQVCAAPIAVINLIAEGKQWFKAELGLGVRETPLDISICARVLLQPGLTVVPDLTQDERFDCNPLVTGEPHLRFYAGALLETPNGLPLGTLCVLDDKPRPQGLTPEQAFTLQALARQTMSQIELRRALREERDAKTRHQLIVESATDYAIFTTDERGHVTSWNEGAWRILGWREDEILGRDGRVIFTPEDREAGAPEQEMETASAQGRAEDERWHVRKAGSRFWASGTVTPLRNGSSGYLKILRDCTEQQQTAKALHEKEERLQEALAAGRMVAFEWDLAAGTATRSETATQVLGITSGTPEDFLRRIHPDDQAGVRAAIAAATEAGTPLDLEFRFLTPAGQTLWLADRARVERDESGRPACIIGVVADITERKLAVERLQEQTNLLKTITDYAAEALFLIDREGRITFVNPAAERMFGWSTDELQGQVLHDLLHHHHSDGRPYPASECPLVWALRSGEPLRDYEDTFFRQDGSQVVVACANAPIMAYGEVSGGVLVVHDISARKKAEAALRESEQRLRATYEHAFVGIAEVDPNGRFLRLNEQFCAVSGYEREELLARTFLEITHPDDRAADLEQFDRQMSGDLDAYTLEKRYIHKDGHIVWIELSASKVDDAAGQPLYGIRAIRDVTERRRAEERRQILVNELNHRVKNTLATVQSIASQTLRSAVTAEEARSALEARLFALSSAHDVLTREHWQGAGLREIVTQALAPYQSGSKDRLHVAGPEVRLSPRMALALAMALQELATNAVKYGALSTQSGKIRIKWATADQETGAPRLHLIWDERGGPPVEAPHRRGFGTRLIERSLAQELEGEVSIVFRREGLVCTIDAPVQNS